MTFSLVTPMRDTTPNPSNANLNPDSDFQIGAFVVGHNNATDQNNTNTNTEGGPSFQHISLTVPPEPLFADPDCRSEGFLQIKVHKASDFAASQAALNDNNPRRDDDGDNDFNSKDEHEVRDRQHEGEEEEAANVQSSGEGIPPELEDAVQDLLSFSGSEHLLRAAPLDLLLRGGGRIFADSKGTEATYSLSSATDHIGYFISHNWAVHRVIKFVALAFKFNMNTALITAFVVIFLCLLTSLLGLQPLLKTGNSEYDIAIGCRLLLVPSIISSILFGRFCRIPGSSPTVFLDKVCIHQADSILQRAGIRKLGAFLRVSDRMLVLYTSVYLKRLWTVYEVASFMTMHEVEQLEMVPVMLPIAFFLVLGGHASFQLLVIGGDIFAFPVVFLFIANFVGATVYMTAQRLWARSRAEIEETLRNFSVHNAECAVEGDRRIVHGNIVALMKASRRVKRHSSAEEALEAFNVEVRSNVAGQFKRIFGKFAFSYREYLVSSLTAFTPAYVDGWSRLAAGQPFREVLGERSLDLCWIFCAFTIWQLSTEVVASQFIHLRGWREVLWVLGSNSILVGLGNLATFASQWLCDRAKTDDTLLVCLLVGQVFILTATFLILPRVCSEHRHHRAPTGSARPAQRFDILGNRSSSNGSCRSDCSTRLQDSCSKGSDLPQAPFSLRGPNDDSTTLSEPCHYLANRNGHGDAEGGSSITAPCHFAEQSARSSDELALHNNKKFEEPDQHGSIRDFTLNCSCAEKAQI